MCVRACFLHASPCLCVSVCVCPCGQGILEGPLIRFIQYLSWVRAAEEGTCVYTPKAALPPALHTHALTAFPCVPGRHRCDVCGGDGLTHRFSCPVCDFDACPPCVARAVAPPATES